MSFGIKQLYSKNERVVLNFKCESFLMTIIMIGAVNVGCILTRHELSCQQNINKLKNISE